MCAQSWWRGIPPVLLLVALLSVPAYAGESVRSQLIRLQNENGLRLVTLAPPYGFVGVPLSGEAVNQVMFETRSLNQEKQVLPPSVEVRLPSSISPDGSQIALNLTMRSGDKYTGTILVVIGFDGHVIGKYAYVYNASDASAICWSPDNSKIALNAMDPRVKPCKPALRILDLKSGAFDEIDGAWQSSVTNECWSPDGQRLVYTHWDGDDTDIRLYDVSKKTGCRLKKRAGERLGRLMAIGSRFALESSQKKTGRFASYLPTAAAPPVRLSIGATDQALYGGHPIHVSWPM